ncbi:disulfide bond formation protein B [Sphingomonas naphthae]|uniref:Disulfide bond formation protein B n=1 Tax=Sphingomonas naphthae TaxID=1813468 RepID=A0ABY7TFJ8_9SPHN|nr:disulfide bond formation protein B [Sphingomonas naphthae]WCT71914.1 disulfide bond formation protein B [Sphingomonas naphthae]
MTSNLARARWIALLLPAALLAGALGSQFIGGLFPCEMCHWQRWPHYAAVAIALAAFAMAKQPPVSRGLVILAGLAILVSGGIGVFHAGVEYHWWQGFTTCTQVLAGGSGEDILARIMKTPLIRCDTAQWSLGGISLAGFNAIFSILGGAAVLALASRRR